MIAAINPHSSEITYEYPCVYNQGQLILHLSRNPQEDVVLDPFLPGHLKIEDLLDIIQKKYPEASISLLEPSVKISVITKVDRRWNIIRLSPVIAGLLTLISYYLMTWGSLNSQNQLNLLFSVFISTIVTIGIQYILRKEE